MAAFTKASFCFIPQFSLEVICFLYTLMVADAGTRTSLRQSLSSMDIFDPSGSGLTMKPDVVFSASRQATCGHPH